MRNMNSITRRTAIALGAIAVAAAVLPMNGHAEEKVIRVLRSPVGQFQPLFYGVDQGIFAKHGLKLEVTIGGSPDQQIAQLQAGQTDIVMTGPASLATAVANGLPVMATLNVQDQGEVPTTGLFVPKDSPIKTVQDLKGKSVGLFGVTSIQAVGLLLALEKAGVSKDDVKIVNIPFDAQVESAEKGNVDAIIPIGLFTAVAQAKGFRDIPEVYAETRGYPAVIWASSKAYLDANADTVKAFNDALIEAYDYGNKNPDVVRAVDLAQTKMPPDYIKNRYIAPFVYKLNREKYDKINADMVRFGFMPKAPTQAEYIWSGAP